MRTTRYVNLSAQGAWPGPVERPQELLSDQTLRPVAEVVLKHRHDEPPAFPVEIRSGGSEALGPESRITCHARQAALRGLAHQQR
jgi:hypothetical protein